MSWHKVTFTPVELTGDIESKLIDDFMTSFLVTENPRGMALYCAEEAEQKTYYISKESANFHTHFKINYHAVACPEPDKDQITFVAGTKSNSD